jgi:hypothetical protein
MKTELTIKTDYLPGWGPFEGIRELLQNGKDAEDEFHAALEVRHRADTNTLVIENEGAVLPREALLFGHTTKVGKSDLRGKFGEGLKLGVLALVRAGHEIKIRSGSEVWVPKIERSEKFNADVLVFHIETGRQLKHRVQIEICGITKADWDVMRTCFLFLDKKSANDEFRVDTSTGALLLRDSDAGKIFVKGIFVEKDSKLQFGYDLTQDVQVDRDRKMVARWDMEWRLRSIWNAAIVQRKDLITKYMEALFENTADVAGIDTGNASLIPKEVQEQVAAKFLERHGQDAVPVDTMADSKDVEHLGKHGVLVLNKPLKAVLQTFLGTSEEIKTQLANEIVAYHGWGDLSTDERTNMEAAIALVNVVEKVSLDDVDVVSFRSDTVVGMFKDSRVLLSKAKLADANFTLETMVHEVAHRFGGDGAHHHVASIERIWSGIVSHLRSSKQET